MLHGDGVYETTLDYFLRFRQTDFWVCFEISPESENIVYACVRVCMRYELKLDRILSLSYLISVSSA